MKVDRKGELKLNQQVSSHLDKIRSQVSSSIGKLQPNQFIKKQKDLCRSFVSLFKISKYFGERFGTSLQSICNTQLINNVYKHVKSLIKEQRENPENPQSFEFYNYIINKYCKKIIDQSFKGKISKDIQKVTLNNQIKNEILTLFKNEQKIAPPQNLQKNVVSMYKAFKINMLKGQKVIIKDLTIIGEQRQFALSKVICSMLNACKSVAMFVGIDRNLRVQGVKLKKNDLKIIHQHIYKVRDKFIFPKRRYNQNLNVCFMKVENIIKSIYDQDKILTDEAFYVIKIYTNTKSIGQSFFVTQGQKNMSYKIFNDEEIPLIQQKVYSQMQKKFLEKKVTRQLFKRKMMIQSQFFSEPSTQYVLGGKVQLKQEQQLKKLNIEYGRLPMKKFAHHSIVVISSGEKSKDKFEEFKNYLQSDQEYFESYQIFDKLNKITSRKVRYMTHRRKPQDLLTCSLRIDDQRRFIVFNKIKPQLSFLRDQFAGKAIELIKQRCEHYLGKRLKIMYKRSNNQNNYFLCFDSQFDAIFAFCLLQYSNIRTNFANKNKIQGAIPIEKQHLKQLLKNATI